MLGTSLFFVLTFPKIDDHYTNGKTLPGPGLNQKIVNFDQISYLFHLMPSVRMQDSGFPGGAVVENLPANAGDTGSSPGLGRSHMPQSD